MGDHWNTPGLIIETLHPLTPRNARAEKRGPGKGLAKPADRPYSSR